MTLAPWSKFTLKYRITSRPTTYSSRGRRELLAQVQTRLFERWLDIPGRESENHQQGPRPAATHREQRDKMSQALLEESSQVPYLVSQISDDILFTLVTDYWSGFSDGLRSQAEQHENIDELLENLIA